MKEDGGEENDNEEQGEEDVEEQVEESIDAPPIEQHEALQDPEFQAGLKRLRIALKFTELLEGTVPKFTSLLIAIEPAFSVARVVVPIFKVLISLHVSCNVFDLFYLLCDDFISFRPIDIIFVWIFHQIIQ